MTIEQLHHLKERLDRATTLKLWKILAQSDTLELSLDSKVSLLKK